VHLGVETTLFPLAPAEVIKKMCKNNNIELDNLDSIEINEAFAVKVLACSKELGLSPEKINSLGGAIAYGHPYGASGAIILIHLLKSLKYCEGKIGVAAIGAGGGTGTGIMLERQI